MKTILFVSFFTINIIVQTEPQQQSDWSYNAGTILMSRYYGTIFGGTFYNGPMSFTDINAIKPNKFGNLRVNAYVGQKLDRLDSYNVDGGNEYNIAIYQTLSFGKDKYPVNIDFGFSYIAITDLKDWGNDVPSETLRLDFPIRADLKDGPLFQPYIQIFHYHISDGFRDGGWIGYAGIIRRQYIGSIFGKEISLVFDYRLGANFGVFGSKRGLEYNRLSIGIPIDVGKWSVTPSLIGQFRVSKDRTYVTKNEFFYSLSIRRSW